MRLLHSSFSPFLIIHCVRDINPLIVFIQSPRINTMKIIFDNSKINSTKPLDTSWLVDAKETNSKLWFFCVDDIETNALYNGEEVTIVGAVEFFYGAGDTGKEATVLPALTINNIQVESEHKRKGYGTEIISEIQKHSVENNIKSISFAVEEDNVEAIAFYKKLSFKELLDENKKQFSFHNGKKNCLIFYKNL